MSTAVQMQRLATRVPPSAVVSLRNLGTFSRGRANMKTGTTKASFIEPMLLLRAETLPEGQGWIYELKLDGYRALAIKSEGTVQLRSRNDKDFTGRYPAIVLALDRLPDESVIDGEVVALDASGRPSFNTLQNLTPGGAPVFYYVFDVLVFAGRNLTGEPLDVRRSLLQTKVLPKLSEPIRQAAELHGSLHDLLDGVRAYGFEGLIAKRRDSLYEPGKRSGAWRKMRINRGQEFVIGGYTPSALTGALGGAAQRYLKAAVFGSTRCRCIVPSWHCGWSSASWGVMRCADRFRAPAAP